MVLYVKGYTIYIQYDNRLVGGHSMYSYWIVIIVGDM